MDSVIENNQLSRKICLSCNQELIIVFSFYNRTQSLDGYRNTCKDCVRQQNKNWRHDNKEKCQIIQKRSRLKNLEKRKTKSRENHKIWYLKNKEKVGEKNKKNKHLLSYRFTRYKSGARVRNIEFLLTLENFKNITEKKCFYCNQFSANTYYCGVDRLDSMNNYTLENCVSCCDICNYMKQEHSYEFFIDHIKKIFNNKK
jgi:hypothetical protein